MDLQPLYDLKERLEYAAIAGTGLLHEDFRLRRAVEAMAPLAAASPVFNKIRASAEGLLAAPAPERGGRLLDTLGLVDAVAYTQGAAGASGEWEDIGYGGGAYVQASYGQLQPLIAALSSTGSGRMSLIQSVWETHPDYFGDFRVLPYVIGALGDSYGELADLAAAILRRQGEKAVPLLQRDFNPAGKRDMVRRVQIIESIAGAGANDFYLSRLEGAEKEVRAALIYALRHTEDNGERLVELCKTERGSGKKAAHWALAKLESPLAWAYWDTLTAKDPAQAAEYMALSTASRAGVLVAEALDKRLAPYEADPAAPMSEKDIANIQTLLFALPGKSGQEICQIYRRMAALGTALDNKSYQGANKQAMAVRFVPMEHGTIRDSVPFSKVVPKVLRRSILFHPAPDLLDLAEELDGKHKGYSAMRLTAALISKGAEEAFALAEPFLKPSGLLQKKRDAASAAVLTEALENLYWRESEGELAYRPTFTDPAAGSVRVFRRIAQPIDRRWYERLLAPGGNYASDVLLDQLLYPTDSQLCAEIGSYFYRRALIVGDNTQFMDYLVWLRRCGWQDCRGLLENYCKRNKVNTWGFMTALERLPGPKAAAANEAERVLALIQERKIAVAAWNPTHIEKWIADHRGQST